MQPLKQQGMDRHYLENVSKCFIHVSKRIFHTWLIKNFVCLDLADYFTSNSCSLMICASCPVHTP